MCATPAGNPERNDAGTHNAAATAAATPTDRLETTPAVIGLSGRCVTRSRSASTASLSQPTESCPVRIASPTATTPGASRPDATASATAASVTAIVGSGWHALTSPQTAFTSALLPADGTRRPGPADTGDRGRGHRVTLLITREVSINHSSLSRMRL